MLMAMVYPLSPVISCGFGIRLYCHLVRNAIEVPAVVCLCQPLCYLFTVQGTVVVFLQLCICAGARGAVVGPVAAAWCRCNRHSSSQSPWRRYLFGAVGVSALRAWPASVPSGFAPLWYKKEKRLHFLCGLFSGLVMTEAPAQHCRSAVAADIRVRVLPVSSGCVDMAVLCGQCGRFGSSPLGGPGFEP